MKHVEGKVAFITGAANGAGFGMAQVFAKNGMKVVLADIRQDSLDRAMAHFGNNPNVHAIRLDVTDREAFARAAVETEKVFGKVHVLCNNAGINLFVPIEECTYNDWDWVMGVNFGGVVNGIQTFIPRIRKHGEGGHIVNTASMAAFLPSAAAGIYTASKYAVRGLSEALRCSLYRYNIGVSVFCPGLINSSIYESEKVRPQRFASPEDTRQEPEDNGCSAGNTQARDGAGGSGGKGTCRHPAQRHVYFQPPGIQGGVAGNLRRSFGYLPEEEAPAGRLAFEKTRRDSLRTAKDEANKIG